MDADDTLGREPPDLRRDHRPRVVADRAEALVAQATHELDPGLCDPDVVPTALGGRPREAVAGERRDHQVEVNGERLDRPEVLDDRAGPAVREDERQRVLVRRADVEEVDPLAVDLRQKLWPAIELGLPRAPVVAGPPVRDEPL